MNDQPNKPHPDTCFCIECAPDPTKDPNKPNYLRARKIIEHNRPNPLKLNKPPNRERQIPLDLLNDALRDLHPERTDLHTQKQFINLLANYQWPQDLAKKYPHLSQERIHQIITLRDGAVGIYKATKN